MENNLLRTQLINPYKKNDFKSIQRHQESPRQRPGTSYGSVMPT